jgi:threonine/homoserine/homoserine lactone efflux protein
VPHLPALSAAVWRGYQGRTAGLVSVLGISTGTLVHITAATVGLSSLVLASAVAFNAVKYVGAAYLVFLGVRRLLTRAGDTALAGSVPRSLRRLYAVAAGTAAERLRGSYAVARFQRWFGGGILVALGVAAALVGPHRSH